MIYEWRMYEVVPGKMGALNARFANLTLDLFAKHDIQVVGFWQAVIGISNVLYYMLAFRDLAHREQAWQAFASDSAWIAGRAETEKDGPLVAKVTSMIFRPTPYSPLQ